MEFTKTHKNIAIGAGLLLTVVIAYYMLRPTEASAADVKKPSPLPSSPDNKGAQPVTTTPSTTPTPAPTTAPALTDAQIQAATATAGLTFTDGKTDFTNYDKAPFAAWVAPMNGINVGDTIYIKQGAKVTLYDTNLNATGSATTNTTPDVGVGTAWGTNSGYLIVKIFDSFTKYFNGATFVGVLYPDIASHVKIMPTV